MTRKAKAAAIEIAPQNTAIGEIQRLQAGLLHLARHALVKDVDYGTIPGTQKPTLYKPGAHNILRYCQVSTEVDVEDLSTADAVRYRVTVTGRTPDGIERGQGIGECSSAEEKYHWRKAVCDQEWADTPADRRRVKWRKGDRGPWSQQQIMTDPPDVANTVLKMAHKRAMVALALQMPGASAIFTQDVEDLPEGLRNMDEAEVHPMRSPAPAGTYGAAVRAHHAATTPPPRRPPTPAQQVLAAAAELGADRGLVVELVRNLKDAGEIPEESATWSEDDQARVLAEVRRQLAAEAEAEAEEPDL